MVRVADPYGRILGFLARSRYFSFQVAPLLYSRGWVDPVPGLVLRKSGSARNRTRASGSVARNSDQQNTEAVLRNLYGVIIQKATIFIFVARVTHTLRYV
jgi:hypothetical protein